MSYERDSKCCCALLCDNLNGAGEPVPFFRCFEETCVPGEPVIRQPVDYELDRETPYTLIGEAVICTVTPLNQFEGLNLIPLCDIDTGVIVGYFAITRTEEDPSVFETLYFDPSGNSIPMAPANSENCTDKQCLEPVGILCYTVERECEDAPVNDYGPWQGGLGDQPVTTQQVLCTSETITFTWDDFVAGQIVNGSLQNEWLGINAFGGPLVPRSFTLSWDQPLRGPFAFLVTNVTPSEEEVTSIVPAPSSVTPNFTSGDISTVHQVYYDDVTGINQITITFQTLNNPSGQINVQLDESVPIGVVLEEAIEVGVYADTCVIPPVMSYYNIADGTEVTDQDIIDSLKACAFEQEVKTVVEEEVCVTVDGLIYTAIKRTTFDPLPVDEFIGKEGEIITPDSWCPGQCDWMQTTAYIFDCQRFDNELPLDASAVFDAAPVGTNTVTFESVAVATLVRAEIVKAQQVQTQEELHSLPVTPFTINTDSGEVYTFNPSALQDGTSVTLVFDETDIIAWGADGSELVTTIVYSIFDSCDCKAVEALQWVKNSDEVYLVDVFDITYDPETGQKTSLLDDQTRLLDFLTLGPFAGPCPESTQVMELNPLCCNDDLVTGSPEIATQRLAWADGSDSSLMYDGGVPIVPTTGNDVDEVRDKLQPGVAPSFVVPANIGFDILATAPTFVESGLNDLSVLNFDSSDNDRLRLDTGNPPNGPFTLFYLVSATDIVLASQACIIAVGPDNSDGDEFNLDDGAWQLSRDGTQPSFIFRITGPSIPAGGPGTDPLMLVQTGPYSAEISPSDGPNPIQNDTYQLERAIATEAEFFNGQFHLITVSYDDVNQILSAYFDGELRLQMDMSVMVPQFQIGSDYFRIFGNRNGAAYLSGQLAEMYFADAFFTPEETAEVNSYLICKWGIDPSLTAGGPGDLELDAQGSYSAPSPFVQIVQGDGSVIYRNTLNGQTFGLPPVPGLALCGDAAGVEDVTSIQVHAVDLDTGETWTPASVPAGHTLTGLTLNVITQAADNSLVDFDGTALANLPAGLSMSWNVNNDLGFLNPPQSIGAGTGGRMIINMTLRDDS